MKKPINAINLEGRIYDFDIEEKVSGKDAKNPGTHYIGGKMSIATDEECLNVVDINFTYVTETTSTGKKNSTYGVLKDIIDNGKIILKDGKDNATLVKCSPSLELNDFYSNRNGAEELVSAKRCGGGFVSKVSRLNADENERNTFTCDMLINGVQRVEADEEKHIDKDYVIVKGAVFNFRKELLPVEFIVRSEGGMKYFESLDASSKNLIFTKVWGKINSRTIVTRKEEESAFGEPQVKEYTRTSKEWLITGTSKPDAVYVIGDEENGITEEEIKKALSDREIHLADVKKRQDEYQVSKNAGNAASTAAVPAAQGGFNF